MGKSCQEALKTSSRSAAAANKHGSSILALFWDIAGLSFAGEAELSRAGQGVFISIRLEGSSKKFHTPSKTWTLYTMLTCISASFSS